VLTNAVTGLPERQLIAEEIEKRLLLGDFVLILVSIKNLSAFREVYGFIASDDLLRAVVIMLRDILNQHTNQQSFLGQLAEENFVLMLPVHEPEVLIQRLEQSIKKSFDYFYNERDRESGRFEHQLRLNIHHWVIRSGSINLQTLLSEVDQRIA
jgi:GGDEF domain-containing protein